MSRMMMLAMALASACVSPIEAQQPAAGGGAVFVAYYWRAKPGMLDAYNDYIKKVAEPIDEDARKAGVSRKSGPSRPRRARPPIGRIFGFFA